MKALLKLIDNGYQVTIKPTRRNYVITITSATDGEVIDTIWRDRLDEIMPAITSACATHVGR